MVLVKTIPSNVNMPPITTVNKPDKIGSKLIVPVPTLKIIPFPVAIPYHPNALDITPKNIDKPIPA